ncbi:MAG TPA: UDP-N-acetylmuramate--L-alanine ligase, partial [Trueperaceae bacterium]|nr:UDP-N-acetylmuramate--L-alanine ligase [Trueperaceae bacterium]
MSKHLHFLGIGGISMSGLARYYSAKGYQVSGCDIRESSTTNELNNEGISVQIGHSSEHLKNIDILVYNKAISNEENELKSAVAEGIEHIGRLELLAELFKENKTIGITGSHG